MAAERRRCFGRRTHSEVTNVSPHALGKSGGGCFGEGREERGTTPHRWKKTTQRAPLCYLRN